MSKRLYERPGLLEQIPQRLHYAFTDGEQRFEWNHLTRRRIFRNLTNFPLAIIDRKILYPDTPIFPWEKAPETNTPLSGATVGERDLFTGLIIKNVGDSLLKFGLSAFTKTVIGGYNINQDFRQITGVCDELIALSHTARLLDPVAAEASRQAAVNLDSPLYKLSTHATEANATLARMVRGELSLTDANMQELNTHLQAISALCEAKAGIPAQKGNAASPIALSGDQSAQLHTEPEKHIAAIYDAQQMVRPSEHIRKVLDARQITNLADAQTLFAFASALLSDGAFYVSSEIFMPKDESFLTGKEAKQLADKMTGVMNQLGVQTNRTQAGQPQNAALPASVMITGNGNIADAKTVLQAANALQSHLRAALHHKTDRMLAYADLHYADVDRLIATDELSIDRVQSQQQQLVEKASALRADAQRTGQNAQAWQQRMSSQSSSGPSQIPDKKPESRLSYVMRPESLHEMWKLYGRALPTYVLQMPLNIIGKVILGHVKGYTNIDTPDWLPGALGGVYQKLVKSTPSGRNLWSNMFQTATYPISESFTGVAMFEALQLRSQDATRRAEALDDALGASMLSLFATDPDCAGRMKNLASSNTVQSLVEKYKDVLGMPADKRTADDYRKLARYFAELGSASQQLFEENYRLFTGDKPASFEGFKDHTIDVLTKGARNGADALMVFGFLRLWLDLSQQQLRSMEYVNPDDQLLTKKKLQAISSQLTDAVRKAGYCFEGDSITDKNGMVHVLRSNAAGVRPGQLLRQDAATQSLVPVSAEEMVDFANLAVASLNQALPVEKLLTATHGKASDITMRSLESLLTEPLRVTAGQAIDSNVALSSDIIPGYANGKFIQPGRTDSSAPAKTDSKGWKGLKNHFLRPELWHEMRLLRDRTFYVQLFSLPVQMVDSFLLGDTRDAKTGKSNIWSRKNLENVAFRTVTFPIVLSYGTLWMRELLNIGGAKAIDKADQARELLRQTIATAADADPSLPSRITALTGYNPALDAAAEKMSLTGDENRMIDYSIAALAGDGKAPSFKTLLDELSQRPAQTIDEAVLKLGLVETVLAEGQGYINVLRYLPPEKRLLDTKGVRKVSDAIIAQAAALTGNAAQFIDFANRVSDTMWQAIGDKPLHAELLQNAAMRERIGSGISKSLS